MRVAPRSFRWRRLRGGRIPVSGVIWLAILAAIGASTLAIGIVARSAPPASPYYDHVTEIDWYTANGTSLGTTSGVNVTQGSTFSTSVTLTCAAGTSTCPDAGLLGFQAANGLGNWPPHVSPCGWFRSTYNLTGSNLPQSLGPGSSVVVTLNLQAPIVTYPNASFVLQQFNYTGWVEVYLTVGP